MINIKISNYKIYNIYYIMYKSKYEKYKLKYNVLLQQGGAGLKTYYISLIPKDITISKRLQLFYNHINDILKTNSIRLPLHITLFKITVNSDTTKIDDAFMMRLLHSLNEQIKTITFSSHRFDTLGSSNDFVVLSLNMTKYDKNTLNGIVINLLNDAEIKDSTDPANTTPIKNSNLNAYYVPSNVNKINISSKDTIGITPVEYDRTALLYTIGTQRKHAYWLKDNVLDKPHISLYKGDTSRVILSELIDTFNPNQLLENFKLKLSWGSESSPQQYIIG